MSDRADVDDVNATTYPSIIVYKRLPLVANVRIEDLSDFATFFVSTASRADNDDHDVDNDFKHI